MLRSSPHVTNPQPPVKRPVRVVSANAHNYFRRTRCSLHPPSLVTSQATHCSQGSPRFNSELGFIPRVVPAETWRSLFTQTKSVPSRGHGNTQHGRSAFTSIRDGMVLSLGAQSGTLSSKLINLFHSNREAPARPNECFLAQTYPRDGVSARSGLCWTGLPHFFGSPDPTRDTAHL